MDALVAGREARAEAEAEAMPELVKAAVRIRRRGKEKVWQS